MAERPAWLDAKEAYEANRDQFLEECRQWEIEHPEAARVLAAEEALRSRAAEIRQMRASR